MARGGQDWVRRIYLDVAVQAQLPTEVSRIVERVDTNLAASAITLPVAVDYTNVIGYLRAGWFERVTGDFEFPGDWEVYSTAVPAGEIWIARTVYVRGGADFDAYQYYLDATDGTVRYNIASDRYDAGDGWLEWRGMLVLDSGMYLIGGLGGAADFGDVRMSIVGYKLKT